MRNSVGWCAFLLLVSRAWAVTVDHTCIDAQDRIIPVSALDQVRRQKILFGHESVGFDVINGLDALSQAQPARYGLRIQHMIQAAWYQRNSGLGEFFFNHNGNPQGKVDAFVAKMHDGCGNAVDIAMMKYCYADLIERTDPRAAFEAYRNAYERLAQEYPKVTFVYWTCPITIPSRCTDRRTAINRLIREHCRTQDLPLLDIADIECHTPDGREITEAGGQKLYEGYARDQGGHLNATGAQRVGRGWWWLMARLRGWAGPA